MAGTAVVRHYAIPTAAGDRQRQTYQCAQWRLRETENIEPSSRQHGTGGARYDLEALTFRYPENATCA